MGISEKILYSIGGAIVDYGPSETILNEGDLLHFYYQIIEGEVKLNNYNEKGKESIQRMLTTSQSFGEFLLFMDSLYPFNAVSLKHCKIIKLSKYLFIGVSLMLYIFLQVNILQKNFYFRKTNISLYILSMRLISIVKRSISDQVPKDFIITVMSLLKKHEDPAIINWSENKLQNKFVSAIANHRVWDLEIERNS
ncbi:Crp/Fnr family transcriptional regulator [Chryseobacterium populi]|uniref:Cyclic nucleotide-binding protein n=1 Tax=Chryseobacterium populi TaxID=1144316 RepID=J2KS90_9FLAO|nr:cyclic nucleotide-binding domain-containing protein [Chryseobacterium populi]EJL75923.1 cyclic nucleotide-binding protein [Chryseobacterium populi]